jgi:outer membrane protein assembly factor BamA
MMQSISAILLLLFLPAVLWGDCAPDYRTDKKSGVTITDFTVEGTTSIGSTELASIKSKLIGACADEESDELEQVVRNLFANRGYFKATVKHLDLKVTDPLAQPKRVTLDAEIDEGQLYTFAKVEFVGNHVFPSSQLRSVLPMRTGDVFRRDEIAGSFDGIRKLYLQRGYADFVFIPNTGFSGTTVILTLDIWEGTQYHMGKLKVYGKLDTADRLVSEWRLQEGSVFDFSYPDEYIDENRALLPDGFTRERLRLIRNCPEASVEVDLILDQSDPALRSLPADVTCGESKDK